MEGRLINERFRGRSDIMAIVVALYRKGGELALSTISGTLIFKIAL
ncbi:MAG TPA: hypothetical protein VKA87_03815 [Nitrososphaeraceae archaeon]|nr:hypothetical protein [Nitrososphaeraceae archaeon]